MTKQRAKGKSENHTGELDSEPAEAGRTNKRS
jgi:hypothetical protein